MHSEEHPSELLQGLNLFLVGMMGAGKTTVGKLVAAQLGYPFIDTDAVVEQLAQRSIPEIFAESGETAFRDLETQVLSELASYTRLAIATGGGIVVKRENWSHLRQGLVVWLDVPPQQIYQRLTDENRDRASTGLSVRPLLQTADPAATLQTLFSDRVELYAQADLHIAVQPGESPESICDRILQAIPTKIKAQQPIPEPIAGNINPFESN